MSVVRTEVALRLRVYDRETNEALLLPVSEAAMSFAVNAVPVCGVHIGLGVDLGTPDLSLRVDSRARKLLRKYQQCQLLGIFSGEAVPDARWPEKAQLLFEGRISGVQDAITTEGAALKITINHWLADLASGSIVASHAANLIPGNKLNYAAAYSAIDSGVKNKISGIGSLADAVKLFDDDIGADVWANGVKRLYAAILTNPGPVQYDSTDCGEDLLLPPDELKRAFARIEGPSSDLGREYSQWAKPLRFLPNAGEAVDTERTEVARSIAEMISHNPVSTVIGADAWTLFQKSIFPDLGLMLVPRISSAIVAPNMPVLREAYCQRIISNDIVAVDSSRMLQKPIRGVGVVGKAESVTGASNDKNPVPVCYFPVDPVPSGKVFYVPPPKWLSGIRLSSDTLKKMLAAELALNGVIGTESFETDEERDEERNARSSISIMHAFARMVYSVMSIQNNTAIVTGRLRFDIAPGSTVEVAAKTEQLTGLGINTPQMQGFVSHVTIMLSAPKEKAYTQFQLQHVRSLEDNERDEFTLQSHPLYLDNFTGCPLSDDLAVPACPT